MKYFKIRPSSLAISEFQIKTASRFHLTLFKRQRWQSSWLLMLERIWKTSHFFSVGKQMVQLLWNQCGGPTTRKSRSTQRTWRHTPQTLAQPWSLLLYSQQPGNGNNLSSFKWQVNNKNVIYRHNGIVVSYKEKLNNYTHMYMM